MDESYAINNADLKDNLSKVVTIVNHADSLNLGDASQLYVEILLIEKALNPKEIFVLSFDPEKEENMINLIKNEKVKFLRSPGRTCYGKNKQILIEMIIFLLRLILIKLLGKELQFITRNHPVLGILRRSDLVIAKGADNLSDSYGFFSLAVQIYNIALPMILNRKIILLGTSIGPFKSRILQKIACYFIKKTYVVVRDMKSMNLLRNEGIDEKRIRFIPDLAFDLPVVPDERYENVFNSSDVNFVGIGISALIHRYVGKDKETFSSILANLCDDIAFKHMSKIILIPHVLSQFNDVDLADAVFSKVKDKRKIIVVNESNPMKIKYIISKLNLLISFRMHPLVHALSLGVPVIGIDYNDKTRELLKLFGKENWVLPITGIDKLPELVDEFFSASKINADFYTIDKVVVSDEYLGLLREVVSKESSI